jgi:hypothetical protein
MPDDGDAGTSTTSGLSAEKSSDDPAPIAVDKTERAVCDADGGVMATIGDDDDAITTEVTDHSASEEHKKDTTSAVVSSSKKARPPYKYDENKITLMFLFANRDGLTVTIECDPSDTVGETKGALLSVWPEGD